MTRLDKSVVAKVVLILLFVSMPVVLGGCADSPLSPTEEDFTTDTFSGTLAAQDAAAHVFTVLLQGTVDVTILTLSPLTTITVGVSLGTWDGATCDVLLENADVRAGDSVGRLMPVGEDCVSIFDVGNISPGTPISYQLQVVHP